MTKQTFTLRRRGGATEEVEFTPLMVISGSVAHRLALHKLPTGNWAVSDPKSGAAVISNIQGWFKGCPVSTRGFTLREARKLAQEQVDNLIERIGTEKFNTVLANPKPF